MPNEKRPDKPTTREVESHQFDLDEVGFEFDAAFQAAREKVKQNQASVHYEYRDNIRDRKHLTHITIIELDGTILYDQDFVLERQMKAKMDRDEN